MMAYRIERQLLRSSFLYTKQKAKVTCNPRLGELRDYDCLAQVQLSQATERLKSPYNFLMKITSGYHSKIHSLPTPSGKKHCTTFLQRITPLPSHTPGQRRQMGYGWVGSEWITRLMGGRGHLMFSILDCLKCLCLFINLSINSFICVLV